MAKINCSFSEIYNYDLQKNVILIQNYQILRRMKSTSFERKYIAKDIRNNKKRIIRKIKKSAQLEKTLGEAIVYKRLKCENLIQGVLDFFIENKELYIVMDYFDEDKTLANYLTEEIPPFQTIINWYLDLAFSVDYLHLHNQSHGKIKADNIFINENNRLVLGEMAFTQENETKCKESDIETLYNLFSEKYPEIHELKLNNHKSIRDFLKDMIKHKNCYLEKATQFAKMTREPINAQSKLPLKILHCQDQYISGSIDLSYFMGRD